jgi:hypothetical protein
VLNPNIKSKIEKIRKITPKKAYIPEPEINGKTKNKPV